MVASKSPTWRAKRGLGLSAVTEGMENVYISRKAAALMWTDSSQCELS
jgi:hypothetical protein